MNQQTKLDVLKMLYTLDCFFDTKEFPLVNEIEEYKSDIVQSFIIKYNGVEIPVDMYFNNDEPYSTIITLYLPEQDLFGYEDIRQCALRYNNLEHHACLEDNTRIAHIAEYYIWKFESERVCRAAWNKNGVYHINEKHTHH